jgi:hypothetical protein
MNFDSYQQKTTTMKKTLFVSAALLSLVIMYSCSPLLQSGLSKDEKSAAQKVDEETIRKAIESRKFIIKLEQLYTFGGIVDLKPRANYILIDGNNAIISAAYFGRQYDIRPIAAINVRGKATKYEVTRKMSKGRYDISMKVNNGSNTFNVYINIDKEGYASASVDNIRIQNARYGGYVVPITRRYSPEPGTEIL